MNIAFIPGTSSSVPMIDITINTNDGDRLLTHEELEAVAFYYAYIHCLEGDYSFRVTLLFKNSKAVTVQHRQMPSFDELAIVGGGGQ